MTGFLIHLALVLALAQPGDDAAADPPEEKPAIPRELLGVEPIKPVLEAKLVYLGDSELDNAKADTYDIKYHFAPDGRSAFIADQYEVILVWPLVIDYWRWWLGALAAVSLLFGLWGVRRILKTRRSAGRPYCRSCNYDLTANVTGKCPECGTVLAEAAPIAGRSTARRLLVRVPWFALPACYLVLNLLPHNTALQGAWSYHSEFADDPAFIADIAGWFRWSSRSLHERFERENAELQLAWDGVEPAPSHWLAPWVDYVDRLREIDLRTGRITATVFTDRASGEAAFSPDGNKMFITDCTGGDGLLWDLRGRRLLATIPSPKLPDHDIWCGTGLERQVRFFGNNLVRSHYVDLIEWDLARGAAHHRRGKPVTYRIENENGTIREAEGEESTEYLLDGTPIAPGSAFSVRVDTVRPDPDYDDNPVTLPSLELLGEDGERITRWEIPHTAKRPLLKHHDYTPQIAPLFYDDGRRMLLIWNPPDDPSRGPRVERWDMERRAFIDEVRLPVRIEYVGDLTLHDHFLFLMSALWNTRLDRSYLVVMDLHSDRVVAALELPENMMHPEHVLYDRQSRRVVLMAKDNGDGDLNNRAWHALHYDLSPIPATAPVVAKK